MPNLGVAPETTAGRGVLGSAEGMNLPRQAWAPPDGCEKVDRLGDLCPQARLTCTPFNSEVTCAVDDAEGQLCSVLPALFSTSLRPLHRQEIYAGRWEGPVAGLGAGGVGSVLKAGAPRGEGEHRAAGGAPCVWSGGDIGLEASPPWDRMGTDAGVPARGPRPQDRARPPRPGHRASQWPRRARNRKRPHRRHRAPPIPALRTSLGGWVGGRGRTDTSN